MINALHLIWVIPLAASFGLLLGALASAAKDNKDK